MRAITLAILLVPSAAAADSFFELSGGASIPVGDDDWDNTGEPSPKLRLRAGGSGDNKIGGFVAADWTPQQTDAQSSSGPFASTDISAHRFRFLIGPQLDAKLSGPLTFTGRVAIGADIARVSGDFTVVGVRSEFSDTDIGFAFEVGGGLWARFGNLQVGGELALPIGLHDDVADEQGEITFEWTSYDVDIMFGVRFLN